MHPCGLFSIIADGTGCDCDNPISCNADCDRYQACFVQCNLCTCSAAQFLDGCTTSNSGRCTSCRTCQVDVQFMVHACTRATNTVCRGCRNTRCAGENYRSGVCSGHVDGFQCNPCEYATCPDSFFRTGSCGTTANPTENSYQCEACSDQVCSGADQYRSGSCSGTSDGYSCTSCTVCAANQYRSAGCTPGVAPQADSTCTALTSCTASQYMSTAPTATTDRACTPVTDCTTFDQGHEASPATTTSDAVCETSRQCYAESEWQVAAPTVTSGRICDPLTTCGPDEYVVTQRTQTSDRVCGTCENSSCAETTFRTGVCDTATGLGYGCETCAFLGCEAGDFRQGFCGGVTNGYNCTTCSDSDCSADTFQTGVCDGTNDGWSCLPCTNANCAAGEFRTGTCSGRNNSYECNLCDNAECPELMFRSGVCNGTVNDWQCNACTSTRCGFQRHRIGACGGESNTSDDGFTCVDDTPYCPAGQYVSQTATATSDLVCTACGEENYMNETDHRNLACTAATQCTQGQYVAAALTPTSDRVCTDCSPGTHQTVAPENQPYCAETWSSCLAGTYVEVLPSTSTDRGCAPCESCPSCNPGDATGSSGSGGNTGSGGSGFNRGGSGYGSGEGEGETAPPLVPCDDCTLTFTDIPNMEACAVPQLCRAGHYEAVPPTFTTNRACAACPAGSYAAAPNADAECTPSLSGPCPVLQYQLAAATPTSDAVCGLVTICDNAGDDQADVVAPPTTTSDRICRTTTAASGLNNADGSASSDDSASASNWWIWVVIGALVALAVVGFVVYRRGQSLPPPSKGGPTGTRDRFDNPAYESTPGMTSNALRANVAASEAAGFTPYDTYDSAEIVANGASTVYGENEPMLYEPVVKPAYHGVEQEAAPGNTAGIRVDNGDEADARFYTNDAGPAGYGMAGVVSVDDGTMYSDMYSNAIDTSQPPEGYLEVHGAAGTGGQFQESDGEYYTTGNKPRPGFNTSAPPEVAPRPHVASVTIHDDGQNSDTEL